MFENDDSSGPCAGSAQLRIGEFSLLLLFTGERVSLLEKMEDIPQVLPDPAQPEQKRKEFLRNHDSMIRRKFEQYGRIRKLETTLNKWSYNTDTSATLTFSST